MASIELEKLFDSHPEVEAETITSAALASRQYRLEMKVSVAAVFLAYVLFSYLMLWLIRMLSPAIYIRVLLAILCVGFLFLALKMIYPINDRLVDRAIRRQLAARQQAGVP